VSRRAASVKHGLVNYVYGVVPASVGAPSRQGIAKKRLRTIAEDDIAAIVSEAPAGAEMRVGRDELTAHAAVLESALKKGPVLPMRFGMVMANAESVRDDLLDRYHDELARQLEELEGKAELRLRAMYEEGALMAEVVQARPDIGNRSEVLRDRPPEASYYERIELGQLVAEAIDRIRAQDTAAVMDVLEPLAVATDLGSPDHEHLALQASFLVETAQMAAFDEAVDDLGRKNAGRVRFKYTGPLPPYSFVELPTGG
jgi:gas vesicle protein GvpL/GvpF